MGKISDIWVRLGLKKEGFDKGMDNAAKKAEGFGGTLNKMKAGAVAVWAAIGASVTAFVKAFVNHSQTMGDMWAQVTGQMKTVWSQFLTSLTNWDWEGFGQRVKDAMDATSKSISAHDAEFEVMNSIKLRKAAMAEELAQLQIIMRDTRKSYDERAKAAQDYLNKVAPLYQAEIDLRKRIYQTDTAEYLQMAGVDATAANVDLLRKFFMDIAPDEELMRQLVEYQKKNLGQQYELSKSDLADIDKFYEQYGMRAAATLNTIASYYQSTNDDVANKAIAAIANYDSSLAAMKDETRRIENVRNSALAMSEKEGITIDTSSVVPSVEEVMEEAARVMNEVTDTDIADAVKHMEDVVNDIDITAPSVKFPKVEIDNGEIEAPTINTDGLQSSIEKVNELLAFYKERTSDALEVGPSEAQVIKFAEFKLPDINTTDLATGLIEVESIIDQYNAILRSVDGELNPTIDTSGLDEALAKAMQVADEYRRQMQVVENMNYMVQDAVVASMTNGMQALMDLAAGVEGVDMKSALAAFIAPLGDTMKQMGAMIMAEGLAMEAFKKSFSNPYAAIAAGAALVAVGSAVSAGLQRMTANPAGGATASYSGGGSYGSSELSSYEHTLNIEVTGKISGSDIVISGNKTNDNWNR